METEAVLQFLTDYGYWMLLPLMIIEGPGVTMLAALLAATGVFNVFVVFILSILGDVIGDILLYGVGRKWGMGFVRRAGKYMGITERLVLKMEKYFVRHGGKTIFVVKSTTGLCWATFTAAGIVKMPFQKFVWYSVLGGVVWSAGLVVVGYFYGYLWQEIAKYIEWAGWMVGGLAVATFIGANIYKKWKSREIIPEISRKK